MTSTSPPSDPARDQLVQYLKIASSLEHCLLNAYLFAACSLKSTFQEFGTDAKRAVYFERVRKWKQTILEVAREEMLHLHYVQSLLRGLGEDACFDLPKVEDGAWVIPSWEPIVEGKKYDEMRIPISPLNLETIHQFVLYESTDTLQNAGPFDQETLEKFKKMFNFEIQIFLEDVFSGNNLTEEAKQSIKKIFGLDDVLQQTGNDLVAAFANRKVPSFRSIGDFYTQLIAPLYEEAFAFGWVKRTNRNMNNEIADQGAEGFLPVYPIYRSKNFQAKAQANLSNPLNGFMRVKDIINEIVEEGEGFGRFLKYVNQLLEVAPQDYYKLLRSDNPPEVVVKGEQLRQSHLYRFASIFAEYQELAARNPQFVPFRTPVTRQKNIWVSLLASDLPKQFNGCYLTLVSWLSRMYEIENRSSDKSRRGAIEMLASWPLMSLAIRPMLELASLVLEPSERSQLFQWDLVSDKPPHAAQLLALYKGKERNEEIKSKMDYFSVRVLEDTALWAQEKMEELDALLTNHKLTADPEEQWKYSVIRTRLQALTVLKEYKAQFDFRMAGGYSDTAPDATYQQTHKDNFKYSESPLIGKDPTNPNDQQSWDQAFVLRLRFGGWGRVNLATDPDPPTDESGCTGTHMLGATDVLTGTPTLDRSLQWSLREDQQARPLGPQIGVHCKDVTLMIAQQASAALKPEVVSNSVGAVQASGAQCSLQISGFHPLFGLTPEDNWNVNLLSKNGINPYLNGENHLISKDGEPIDPFIFSLSHGGEEWFHCEIFNDGKTLKEMEPYQRTLTGRWPLGLLGWNKVMPEWVKQNVLSEKERKLFTDQQFPMNYLEDRRHVIAKQLNDIFTKSSNAGSVNVDDVVSLASRLRRITNPRGTTVGWLSYTCDYGHTLSGKMTANTGLKKPTLLDQLEKQTGLKFQLQAPTRDSSPNSRWLINYNLAAMDTDALANLLFGEVYIPLQVVNSSAPIKFERLLTSPLLKEADLAQGLARVALKEAVEVWKANGGTVKAVEKSGFVVDIQSNSIRVNVNLVANAIAVGHQFQPKQAGDAVGLSTTIANVVEALVLALQKDLTLSNANH